MEPFGDWAAWSRWAQSMALHANVNRDPKREAFKAIDFMPSPVSTQKDTKQEAEQVKALFVGMFGERVKRK